MIDPLTGMQKSQPSYTSPTPVKTYSPPSQSGMSLFSDEKSMYEKMLADNVSDEEAHKMLKQRRTDLLWGNDISEKEKEMLKKMQADNLTAKESVAMIKQRRMDMENKANSIHDLHADEWVVEQTAMAIPRAIRDTASQAWQWIGKATQWLINESFRWVNAINGMIGSSDYNPNLWEHINKETWSSWAMWDLAKIWAGTTGAIFNTAKAPLALWLNIANEAPGTQYITQGIGHGINATAEWVGGLFGASPETSRDIAATGMNLLGLKWPGANTMEYANNIKSAYKGMENPTGGGIIPAMWEAIREPIGAVKDVAMMPVKAAKWIVQVATHPLESIWGGMQAWLWAIGKLPIGENFRKWAENLSDSIQTWLNRMTKGDIQKFEAEQGVSPGKFLNDRGIVDSGKPIENTLLDEMKKSRDQATEWTNQISGNFKMPPEEWAQWHIDYMREMLQDNLEKAIATKKSAESLKAKNLLEKYDKEGLTMAEINDSKRTMADNNPINWLTDHASNRVQLIKELSNKVREWQFKVAEHEGFTNLKDINKQTQALYKLYEGISKWNEWIKWNNQISLTDYLAFDADPSLFIAKKVFSSPTVRGGIVKWLNEISWRVAKPIEKATIDNINSRQWQKYYDPSYSNPHNAGSMDLMRRLVPPSEWNSYMRSQEVGKDGPSVVDILRWSQSPKSDMGLTDQRWSRPATTAEDILRWKVHSDNVQDSHIESLYRKYLRENHKGTNIVIDSDKIKEMFSNYEKKNPGTVHEKSSELAKAFFLKSLMESKNKKVVFTAWWGGSWKSEVLIKDIPHDSGTTIFDGTWKNYRKIIEMHDLAKEAGKEPEIHGVYINFNKAKEFNEKRDRTVWIDALSETHSWYRKTMLKIAQERPDIKQSLTINTWERWADWKPIVKVVPSEFIGKFMQDRQELETN